MSLPQIAIVGRPNVGKSSLLNRLARRRVSIVDPTPGVTRDRVTTVVELDPPMHTPRGTPEILVEVVDTGGYGVYTAEGGRFNEIGADLSTLTPDIEVQIRLAREQADLVLFVTDARAGLTTLDQNIATMLREEGSASKVLPVANKVDGEEWEPHGLEMAGLGFGEPMCVSAQNGHGVRDLLDTSYDRLIGCGGDADAEAVLKLAIVGKRNAGKSTLINALAGEPRMIVSEIAGTTRDSVDVRFEMDGQALLAIDTAGVRRKKSFADSIEYYAYHRMLQSIRRADVALLLIDATEPVSHVDQKLSQELQRQFKPTIIVVNKWDLVDDSTITPDRYLQYLTEQLRGLDYAPIVFVSAEEAEGLNELMAMAFTLDAQARHRESTGPLNKEIESILGRRGPSSRLGTQAKLLYAAQVSTQPPTVVLVVNDPRLFRGRYERYLLNRLREVLPFSEVPIRLLFKRRTRQSLAAMKEQGAMRKASDAD